MERKEEVISFNREILNNPKIRAFSTSNKGEVNYIISLDSKDEVQKHEERIALAEFKVGKLRILKQKIITLLKLIADGKAEKSTIDFSIEQLKKDSDISLTPEMLEILSICTDKNKMGLEQISVTRENKIEEMIQDNNMNYKKMDDSLPTQEKLDLKNIPNETIQNLGAETQERLNKLGTIKSEEDAKSDKNSLESFMIYQEDVTDRDKILLKFINKIDKLDPDTIIATLKAIEDADIKYSKLYPIYLRIQEKRIIKKVQMYLIGLKSREVTPDGQLEKFLELLDEQKIEDVANTGLSIVIADFIGNENNEVERYIKSGRPIDFEMMRYINSQEETGERAEEKEEVLTYLKGRVASLRQIGKNFDNFEFRSYIEDTDFKDEDETEQNQFLYEVAKIEKKFLIQKYGDLLDKYKEQNQDKPKSLSGYRAQLYETEQAKKEFQKLYEGYTELLDRKKNKETGDKGIDDK